MEFHEKLQELGRTVFTTWPSPCRSCDSRHAYCLCERLAIDLRRALADRYERRHAAKCWTCIVKYSRQPKGLVTFM